MTSWREIWSRPPGTFGPRTTTASDALRVADQLLHSLNLGPHARLLDYGCGPALASDFLLDRGLELLLYDSSPHFTERALAQYRGRSGVQVLDDAGLERIEPNSVDAVLVCSVLQYLDDTERDRLFLMARRVLKAGGSLVLVDVIPEGSNLAVDLVATLRSDVMACAPPRAAANLVALGLSLGRRIVGSLELRRYGQPELADRLSAAGFEPRLQEENFKPNPSRCTWIGRLPVSSKP